MNRRSLCWVLPLGIATAASAAEPPDFKPRFEVGGKVRYVSRSIINHRVQVEDAGLDERIVVRTESGMTLTVRNVDSDGVADVLWSLHYMALATDGMIPGISGMLDYDSRDPDRQASPLAPVFRGLVEQPATIRVNRAGEVMSFEAPQPKGMAGPMAGLVRGLFSKEAFEQLPLLVTAGAPARARVRASWSRQTAVDMPLGVGALVIDQHFTVKRISARHGTAVIEVQGEVTKGTATGAAGGILGLLIPPDTFAVDQGSVSGQYVWDYASGRLESAETQFGLATTLNTPVGRMRLRQDMTSSVRRTHPPDRPSSRTAPPRKSPDG